jgi:hypothetical protein
LRISDVFIGGFFCVRPAAARRDYLGVIPGTEARDGRSSRAPCRIERASRDLNE